MPWAWRITACICTECKCQQTGVCRASIPLAQGQSKRRRRKRPGGRERDSFIRTLAHSDFVRQCAVICSQQCSIGRCPRDTEECSFPQYCAQQPVSAGLSLQYVPAKSDT